MAYNVQANLLDASISKDTQGIAPGITAAGNAFAGALQTYGQNKRADARRVEDRQWQQEDNQTSYARQEARDNKLYARQDQLLAQQKQERELEKAFKQKEEVDTANGMSAAAWSMFGNYISPDGDSSHMKAIMDGMTPKAKMEFSQNLMRYGAQQQQRKDGEQSRLDELNFRAAEAERERAFKAIAANTWSPVPAGSVNQLGSMSASAKPDPAETLARLMDGYGAGMEPRSITVGGVTVAKPAAQKQGSIAIPGVGPGAAPIPSDLLKSWMSQQTK